MGQNMKWTFLKQMQKRKNKNLAYSSFASTFTLNNFVDFDQNLTKIHEKWLNFSEKIDFFGNFKLIAKEL